MGSFTYTKELSKVFLEALFDSEMVPNAQKSMCPQKSAIIGGGSSAISKFSTNSHVLARINLPSITIF